MEIEPSRPNVLERLGDLYLVSDVQGHSMKTIFACERSRLLQARIRKIETNYKMALLGECNSGGLPNARPSAGNDYDRLFVHQ
jgi:hypothetical protein